MIGTIVEVVSVPTGYPSDLIGRLGLIEAIDDFDKKDKILFISFAKSKWWLRPQHVTTAVTAAKLVTEAHNIAKAHGFWDQERNEGEMIALMHSELSEALEALRHGNPPSEHIPEFSAVEEEMADVFIRLADFCEGKKYRLLSAIRAKMAYNKTRPHKHGKEF